MDALETTNVYLTYPKVWDEKLRKVAATYGLKRQDLIKQIIGEYLKLLPSTTREEEKHQCPPQL